MINQSSVALNYITNEINHKYETLSSHVRETLIYACNNFVKGQISYENARQIYQSVDSDISFLVKLQRILTIENEPLPTPETLAYSSKRQFGVRKKSSPWTEIEDLRLVAAIFRYGAKDWRQIAEFVGNDRSSSQCNQRWCRAIDPNISHTPWSSEEDAQLLRAVEILGNKNWCQVAKIMNRRTDLQCRYRYQQITRKNKNIPDKNSDQQSPESDEETPKATTLQEIATQRRSSITIAPFVFPPAPSTIPHISEIPYFLDTSMTPRKDMNVPMLHRLPPLIYNRTKTLA
ncbi:Myb-like DNA-binding domain containing protein [Trichomonas vaginalis G3]|uniref:Myb-like DNA-binding domain containing protein n=1 Tax=Trichomonas vaginalis (strain ATCC PRA-98 / G3) TaxID=412133 RepID=A2F4C1_TRIV3|nr:snRNA-activating protein complex subunit 4 family [Trichomonas vaginalis G3]EAY00241.1 Myb-like DNA-binding domain containing protein [Trichomonas vaginalis G3]KAI5536796.1 snRNA-activating protein complex subunit 4 family [Trichomonas vaginalis G3]|eukprot:XP_001313170.1 Myb-like DNA-binding domain containing protein [Trichomonas vaginalis G3]